MAAGDRLHARRVCDRPAERPLRSGSHAAHRQARHRNDRPRRGVRPPRRRPPRNRRVPARGFPREWQDRQRLRFQRHQLRSRSPSRPSSAPTIRLLESIIAPTTTAMVDFVTRVVGWKTDARYNALSYEVNSQWDRRQPRHCAPAPCPTCARPSPPIPKCASLSLTAGTISPALSWPPSSPWTRCLSWAIATACRRPRISWRPHVLQPRGQPGCLS